MRWLARPVPLSQAFRTRPLQPLIVVAVHQRPGVGSGDLCGPGRVIPVRGKGVQREQLHLPDSVRRVTLMIR